MRKTLYWAAVLGFCLGNFAYQWLPIGQNDYVKAFELSFFQVVSSAYLYFAFYKKDCCVRG